MAPPAGLVERLAAVKHTLDEGEAKLAEKRERTKELEHREGVLNALLARARDDARRFDARRLALSHFDVSPPPRDECRSGVLAYCSTTNLLVCHPLEATSQVASTSTLKEDEGAKLEEAKTGSANFRKRIAAEASRLESELAELAEGSVHVAAAAAAPNDDTESRTKELGEMLEQIHGGTQLEARAMFQQYALASGALRCSAADAREIEALMDNGDHASAAEALVTALEKHMRTLETSNAHALESLLCMEAAHRASRKHRTATTAALPTATTAATAVAPKTGESMRIHRQLQQQRTSVEALHQQPPPPQQQQQQVAGSAVLPSCGMATTPSAAETKRLRAAAASPPTTATVAGGAGASTSTQGMSPPHSACIDRVQQQQHAQGPGGPTAPPRKQQPPLLARVVITKRRHDDDGGIEQHPPTTQQTPATRARAAGRGGRATRGRAQSSGGRRTAGGRCGPAPPILDPFGGRRHGD